MVAPAEPVPLKRKMIREPSVKQILGPQMPIILADIKYSRADASKPLDATKITSLAILRKYNIFLKLNSKRCNRHLLSHQLNCRTHNVQARSCHLKSGIRHMTQGAVAAKEAGHNSPRHTFLPTDRLVHLLWSKMIYCKPKILDALIRGD